MYVDSLSHLRSSTRKRQQKRMVERRKIAVKVDVGDSIIVGIAANAD